MHDQFAGSLQGEQVWGQCVSFCQVSAAGGLSRQRECFDLCLVAEVELQEGSGIGIDSGGPEFFKVGVHFHDTPEAGVVLAVDLEDEASGDCSNGAEIHNVCATIQVKLDSGGGGICAQIEAEFGFADD